MTTRSALPTLLALACLASLPSRALALDVKGTVSLQYDWADFSGGRADNGTEENIRRARLGANLVQGPLDLRVEYDLKSDIWTDAFLRWSPGKGHSLRIGQFKQPVYLDELTSDRVTVFMEQALPGALGIGRRLGIGYDWSGGNWTATVTGFGQDLSGLNAGRGWAGRLVWLPWRDEHGFLHLAASTAWQDLDVPIGRFAARPEAALYPRRLVDTGALTGVEAVARNGFEAAWVRGSWLVQSEYLRGRYDRPVGDFVGGGWYAQASWLSGGAQRGWRNGTIDGPKVEDGSVFELGARISDIDLDDGAIAGGNQRNLGIGATWWLSSGVRVMANYIDVDSTRRGIDDDPRIIELRVQLSL
jgi:phosphate-selective porin OprO/OprP